MPSLLQMIIPELRGDASSLPALIIR